MSAGEVAIVRIKEEQRVSSSQSEDEQYREHDEGATRCSSFQRASSPCDF